jgi:hypothetical protein
MAVFALGIADRGCPAPRSARSIAPSNLALGGVTNLYQEISHVARPLVEASSIAKNLISSRWPSS